MTYTTVNVTCRIYDSADAPVQGASITAQLTGIEIYSGYVLPTVVEGVTDATGSLVLALFPNQLGATQSSYIVNISYPSFSQTLTVTVPNADCFLHQVANLPPYIGKTDGQLAIDAAVAAVAPAQAAASAASTSATAAASSASAAAGSATTASNAAATATAQAATATTKASEAATSATSSANSAAAALASANAAATSETNAAGSATTATAQAATATTQATNASNSAGAAATSATEAAASASTYASNALQIATAMIQTQTMFVARFAFI